MKTISAVYNTNNLCDVLKQSTLLGILACCNMMNVAAQPTHNFNDGRNQNSDIGASQVQDGSGTLIHTIPLFNLVSKGVSMPISLTYIGDGVKVDSKASWVGQGWELQAGGEVTRIINGCADDLRVEYPNYQSWSSTHPEEAGFVFRNYNIEEIPNGIQNVQKTLGQGGADHEDTKAKNRLDTSPDLYIYSAITDNGQFTLVNTGDFIANQPSIATKQWIDLSGSSHSISASTNSERVSGFQINNKSGIRYSFIEGDEIRDSNYAGIEGNARYCASWKLKEVRNELNEIAYSLSYSGYHDQSLLSKNASRTASLPSQWYFDTVKNDSRILRKTYIESIQFDNGRVDFITYLDDRDDLEGHEALRYIRIYNNTDILPIQEVEFLYNYGPGAQSVTKRLYLETIKFKENDGNTIKEPIDF